MLKNYIKEFFYIFLQEDIYITIVLISHFQKQKLHIDHWYYSG